VFSTWTPQRRLGRTSDADAGCTSVPRDERLPERWYDDRETLAERRYRNGSRWWKDGEVCDARVAFVMLVSGTAWCTWGVRGKERLHGCLKRGRRDMVRRWVEALLDGRWEAR
jgi:hypothetical protein